jgi:hypothetical protein
MAECMTVKTIKEEDIDEAMSPKQKQYSNRVKTMPGKKGNVMAKSNFEAPYHRVEATISRGGKTKEIVKHEVQAKDKHDAMFNVQLTHHKAGHKVHDTKYKGIVKEEAEQIDELSTDLLHRAANKAAKVAMTDVQGRSGPIFKKRAAQANKFRTKGMEQEKKERAMKEEALDEVLTKSTSAGETISDFVHSDNPKFAGKSKEKRKQMALAVYYAKQREQKEDLAVPLLGGDGDDESAEMAKAELKAIANQAMNLVMQIPDTMIIEPWVQSKIAQAKVHISGVHDYMIYGDHDKEKENEGTMDTPMTFPNMSVDVNTGQNV